MTSRFIEGAMAAGSNATSALTRTLALSHAGSASNVANTTPEQKLTRACGIFSPAAPKSPGLSLRKRKARRSATHLPSVACWARVANSTASTCCPAFASPSRTSSRNGTGSERPLLRALHAAEKNSKKLLRSSQLLPIFRPPFPETGEATVFTKPLTDNCSLYGWTTHSYPIEGL
jgi:hypothetical protein